MFILRSVKGNDTLTVSSNSGSILLTTLLAMSISTASILAMQQSVVATRKQQLLITQNNQFENVRGMLQNILSKPGFCASSLRHRSAEGGSVQTAIYAPSNSITQNTSSNPYTSTSPNIPTMNEISLGNSPNITVFAKPGMVIGDQLRMTNLFLAPQISEAGTPMPPIVNAPTVGQTTHFVQLIMEAERQIPDASNRSHVNGPPISNGSSPLKMLLTTTGNDDRISGCVLQDNAGDLEVPVPGGKVAFIATQDRRQNSIMIDRYVRSPQNSDSVAQFTDRHKEWMQVSVAGHVPPQARMIEMRFICEEVAGFVSGYGSEKPDLDNIRNSKGRRIDDWYHISGRYSDLAVCQAGQSKNKLSESKWIMLGENQSFHFYYKKDDHDHAFIGRIIAWK